jgi:hypothetical protein
VFTPITKSIPRPFFEFVKVWNLYPDLSAPGWRRQEAIFERMVVLRSELNRIKKRTLFDTAAINQFMKDNPTGNYTARTHETELGSINNVANVSMQKRNKYEIIRMIGYLSGTDLRAAGVVGISDRMAEDDVLAEVWLLDDIAIKIDLAPFGDNPADNYHAFIFEEDEDSGLTGTGLPQNLRDSQMRLCTIDRATQDNMAAAAGPIFEINEDLLAPGFVCGEIHSFKIIRRQGEGAAAQAPALHIHDVPCHVQDFIALRAQVLENFDRESSLPAFLFGQTQNLGEAFRTTNNMSMMSGGANMVSKDYVRSFDLFTSSVIGSMVSWNMDFNEKEEIKGDYNVVPRGNLSLVAKEVRGAALDQFWASLTPEERLRFKDYEVLIERLRSRDLPVELLEPRETGDDKVAQFQQAQAQAAQIESGLTQAKTQKLAVDATDVSTQTKAKTAEILARVEATLSQARTGEARQELEQVKTMLQSLQKSQETATKVLALDHKTKADAQKAAQPAPKKAAK